MPVMNSELTPDRLLARDWMDTKNGVDQLNRDPANEAFDAVYTINHQLGRMNGL